MADYLDLVLVTHSKHPEAQRFLFRAPRFSYIKAGDQVICVTKKGEAIGYVVDSITVSKDGEEYGMIARTAGCPEIKPGVFKIAPIKYKVQYSLLEYPDEEKVSEEEVGSETSKED